MDKCSKDTESFDQKKPKMVPLKQRSMTYTTEFVKNNQQFLFGTIRLEWRKSTSRPTCLDFAWRCFCVYSLWWTWSEIASQGVCFAGVQKKRNQTWVEPTEFILSDSLTKNCAGPLPDAIFPSFILETAKKTKGQESFWQLYNLGLPWAWFWIRIWIFPCYTAYIKQRTRNNCVSGWQT